MFCGFDSFSLCIPSSSIEVRGSGGKTMRAILLFYGYNIIYYYTTNVYTYMCACLLHQCIPLAVHEPECVLVAVEFPVYV